MKKGMMYTVVVLIFLIIMMTVFYTYDVYKFGEKQDVIETRVKTMNEFINDLNKDAERAAYIAGFRSLIALEEYVSERGEFLNNTEEIFRKIFYSGSIGNFSPEIMNASSFSEYLARVNQKSDDIDISLEVNVTNLTLIQDEPWSIRVEVLAELNLVDERGLASWNYDKTFSSAIPITGLKDPLYSVNTFGRFQSFVRPTNFTEFVVNNQTTNLISHIENSYYKVSDKAPSFLMRFEGDLSNSSFGIESLVDIDFLEKQEDITVDYTRSVVDYIYFGNQTTNNVCDVENMPSWFKIDTNHINDYEINELSYVNCSG